MKRKPYRHLLVPTDGSPGAERGVKAAVALARALGARVRGLYVAPRSAAAGHGVGAIHGARILLQHFDAESAATAKRALGVVKSAAKAADVRCSVETTKDDQPWRGMLRVARKRRCDLVVLAPRRRGLLGWPVRGETARVLSRSTIAVLTVR